MSGNHADRTTTLRSPVQLVVIPVVTAASIALAWAGQPVAVVTWIGFLSTAQLARRYGWLLSWAMVLVLSALAVVGLLTASAHVSPDLGLLVTTCWTVMAAALGVLQLWRPSPALNRQSAQSLAIAGIVPFSVGALFLGQYLRSGGGWIGWAMPNDVVWRTRVVRWTLEEGGARSAHSSPDPLTTLLNAVWSAQGNNTDDPGAALGHIVVQSAQTAILVWLLVSLAIAAMTVSSLRGRPLGVRIVCSSAVAALPWTWFMSGYAFEYGFQNAGPSVLVLVAAWLMWSGVPAHPVVGTAGLVLATVALVVTWAPLGVVGVALLAASLWHLFRQRVRPSLGGWLLIGASLGVAAGFALAVTWVALRQNGSDALASEGAMLTFHPARTAVLTAVVVLAGAVVAYRAPASRHDLLGAAFALAGVGAACAVLLYIRRDSPMLWGYYPIKFVWLVSSAAILILASTAIAPVSRLSSSWVRGNGTVVMAGFAIVAMVLISPKPPTTESHVSPLNLVRSTQNDSSGRAVIDLFARHRASMVSGYSQSPTAAADDGFTNFWLLQMDSVDTSDPIRVSAYTLDTTSPREVCRTARLWASRGPVIWTSSAEHAAQLSLACKRANVTVDVRIARPPEPSR